MPDALEMQFELETPMFWFATDFRPGRSCFSFRNVDTIHTQLTIASEKRYFKRCCVQARITIFEDDVGFCVASTVLGGYRTEFYCNSVRAVAKVAVGAW
jgi:hypothetical protein